MLLQMPIGYSAMSWTIGIRLLLLSSLLLLLNLLIVEADSCEETEDVSIHITLSLIILHSHNYSEDLEKPRHDNKETTKVFLVPGNRANWRWGVHFVVDVLVGHSFKIKKDRLGKREATNTTQLDEWCIASNGKRNDEKLLVELGDKFENDEFGKWSRFSFSTVGIHHCQSLGRTRTGNWMTDLKYCV